MRRLPLPLLLLSLAAALPQTALATPGAKVAASLRYADGSTAEAPVWSSIRISITRNGSPVDKERALPRGADASFLHAPVLRAVDLDGDAEPEVLVDVTAPAYDRVRRTVLFHWTGTAYRSTVLDWSSSGYAIRRVLPGGGKARQLVAQDGRFSDLYSGSAPGPLRILAVSDGRAEDVTAQAPARLLADLHRQQRGLASARRTDHDVRATLAAVVVDLVRLDRADEARAAIRLAARSGELRGASATAFARQVAGRMTAWDYPAAARLTRRR